MLELIHLNTSGVLPTSRFQLRANSRRVGAIQIRHKPAQDPRKPPGCATHVYFSIIPDERGKGYGREILRLGLIEARKLGLTEVFVGAFEDNPASCRVIEANGGEFVRTFVTLDTGEHQRHYRIRL